MKLNFKKFNQIIAKAQGILLTAHRDPDLDAIGSLLALNAYLEVLNIPTYCWLSDKLHSGITFLPQTNKIHIELDNNFKYNVLIVLDSFSMDRIKNAQLLYPLDNKLKIINIDHHLSNTLFGSLNLVNIKATATAEIIFDLFKALDWQIIPRIATYLYAALISDTGRFLFNNTTIQSFEITTQLLKYGADHKSVMTYCFKNFSIINFELLKQALNNLVIKKDLNLVYTVIHQEHQENNFKIIDFIQQLGEFEIFIVFQELANNEIKINLRSKDDFDVNKFAIQFGGGGHRNAAGIRLNCDLEEAKNKILGSLYSLELPSATRGYEKQ